MGVHGERIPDYVLPDRSLPQGNIGAHTAATDSGMDQVGNKLSPGAIIVGLSTVEYQQHTQHDIMARL